MIVHCPKCNSFIGEGLSSCPTCHAEFSASDKEVMAREKRERTSAVHAEEKKAFDDFKRKRKIFLISLIVDLLLVITAPFVVMGLTGNIMAGCIVLGVCALAEVAIIIIGIVTGGATCPHCGAILYRHYGDFCNRCGGRVR